MRLSENIAAVRNKVKKTPTSSGCKEQKPDDERIEKAKTRNNVCQLSEYLFKNTFNDLNEK